MAKFNINSQRIKDYIEDMAKQARKISFYPQAISRKLNIPIDLVMIELTNLMNEGIVDLKYEIRCSDDLNIIKTVDNYENIIHTELYCDECGNYVEITNSNIYPIYNINEEYKKYIKSKKKI